MTVAAFPDARFRPGDRVHVKGGIAGPKWTVVDYDWWIADREQAYKLADDVGNVRYAYDRCLSRIPEVEP